MIPDKGGRPSHQPTADTRKTVEAMTGFGIPADDIARVISVTGKTLRKYYRDELDLGTVKANSKVAQNLFKKATGDTREGVTAAIFWLKTRAGWRETVVNLHAAPDGGPIQTETTVKPNLSALDPDERDALRAILERRAAQPGGGPEGA